MTAQLKQMNTTFFFLVLMNRRIVLQCSVADLLETIPFHSIHSENHLSSWAVFNSLPKANGSWTPGQIWIVNSIVAHLWNLVLIQFNWMHPEALDCKMQSHHVIRLHSLCVCVHQQLCNIFTMAWLWAVLEGCKGGFLSFYSTATHTMILMTFIDSVCTRWNVCMSRRGCIVFLLH